MTRPRLLDLFCGAGGCSVGFARAGFDITGVDKLPHPDYPFEMVVGDALAILDDIDFLSRFDVVSASPPCPFYSTITPSATRGGHPHLIPPVREGLQRWGGVYVIENVQNARKHMLNPIRLCGSSFGLRVRRHRLFESNAPLAALPCQHQLQGRPVGVYGDHPQNDHEYRRPDGTRRGAKATSIVDAQDAMGIDWMSTWDDLTDAIPPAMTEYIGKQLLAHIAASRKEKEAA